MRGTEDKSMHTAGDVLQGRYRVDAMLGRGGMGGVYLAHHLTLGVDVALKEMTLEIQDPNERAAAVRQFQQEARMLHDLHHPGLPRVHDFFEVDGRWYLVMDLIKGRSLEQVCPGPMPEATVLQWAQQIGDVLQFLHSQEPPVIFRDLKPSNVMLTDSGQIKLIDFGIAKAFDRQTGLGTQTMSRGAGSPGFAAPEQYGVGTDARTDIYAYGATLWALLVHQVPPPSVDIASGTVTLSPVNEFRPDVTPKTTQAIAWMMTINREKRPRTIAEAMQTLGLPHTGELPGVPFGGLAMPVPTSGGLAHPAPGSGGLAMPMQVAGALAEGAETRPPRAAPAISLPPAQTAAPLTRHLLPQEEAGSHQRWLGTLAAIAVVLLGLVAFAAHRMLAKTAPAPRARVHIMIVTDPPGAQVLIHDVAQQQLTPFPVDAEVGSDLSVVLKKAGYLPAGDIFTVRRDGQQFQEKLVPAPITFNLHITPDNAHLMVDRKPYGAGILGPSVQLSLDPGPHIIDVSANGYKRWSKLLPLSIGQKQSDLDIRLESLLAIFKVSGNPSGARIIVDGRDMGASPRTLKLPPGIHSWHAEKAGFLAGADQQVTVQAGIPTDLTYSLEPRQATVVEAPPQQVVLQPPHPGQPPRVGREKWEIQGGHHIGPISLGDPITSHPDFEYQSGNQFFSIYASSTVALLVNPAGRVVAVAVKNAPGGPEVRTRTGITFNSTEAAVRRDKHRNEMNRHPAGEGLMQYPGISFGLQHGRVFAMFLGDPLQVRTLLALLPRDAGTRPPRRRH
ncbi:MAG: protein kinase domain-containing protein [Candidatus Xenobia bacterium]